MAKGKSATNLATTKQEVRQRTVFMPTVHLRSLSFHASKMAYVTSLSLLRLTRRVEFLEGSLYAISFKLNELEVENASHSERY